MVTGLLKSDKEMITRVKQAYFLFPTLEYIAKSPFGKLHVKYGGYFLKVSLFLTWVSQVKYFLISCLIYLICVYGTK